MLPEKDPPSTDHIEEPGNRMNAATTTTTATIRKIAILLHGLEMDAVDKLLDQLPPADVALLRDAMMSLEDIDAAEQEAILADFLPKKDPPPPVLPPEVVEAPPAAAPARVPDSQPATGFGLLETASPALVAARLQQEQPQAMAAILSRLEPGSSAAILRELPHELQVELLRRITELDSLPGSVIDELASSMEQLLQLSGEPGSTARHGLAAAHAILQATDPLHRHDLMDRLAIGPPSQEHSSSQPPTPWLQAGGQAGCSHVPAARGGNEDDQQFVIRFDDLALLDDTSLAILIQSVDSQLVLLALAGASREFVDRILQPLEPRESRQLRRHMEQIGPLQLQDITRAQQALASHAIQLASEGRITIHNRRRFVMAA
jgi:flagellar motor switch protein FliG